MRSAVAAAFVALVFHTMLYADFLEDPTTWALLGSAWPWPPRWASARLRPAKRARSRGTQPYSGVVYAPLMPPSTRNVVALT